MLKGFEPIVALDAEIMILGSMPSVTSLEKQEYYGFKQNRFWKIMQQAYQMPIDTYAQRKQIILEHRLLLWDVICSCEREGSLDANIRHEIVNPIDTYIQMHGIKKVICNGRKSFDLYQKHFSHVTIPCIYLPSTSNANRSIKEKELYAVWKAALIREEITNDYTSL